MSRENVRRRVHGRRPTSAKIVAHTAGQAEFVGRSGLPGCRRWRAKRIAAGKAKYAEQRRWVDKAEQGYGVTLRSIMGIWGIETGSARSRARTT